MKKRYILLLLLILLIVLSVLGRYAPVRPFIQLAGEFYPGIDLPAPFYGITNTFAAALLAYAVLLVVALAAGARGRSAQEVPTGFYNFMEMLVEGAFGFVNGIVGDWDRTRVFFPFFLTPLLLLLLTNLMGLLPGFDSIGIWENKPHFFAEQDVQSALLEAETEFANIQAEAELQDIPLQQAVADALSIEAFAAEASETTDETELLHLVEMEYFATRLPAEEVEHLAEEGRLTLEELEEAYLHELEIAYDEENVGDISTSNGEGPGLLLRALEGEDNQKPEDADWTIVPFFRPAATDLSLTLAIAIVSMIMVQVYGFRYLGLDYLSKFFPVGILRGFADEFATNPMGGIVLLLMPVVGILELISEFAKVISFAFRLLGAMFGGMVLLFVLAGIFAGANVVFYALELFVGPIQAFVFAFLTVIFMKNSTEHHGLGDDHNGHH
ncbi:MAG: F0F1 ATP synthase subunit A [Candidatus Promineifilaceae bacterium]|nr:F0F1 ATP synthase subunit A [Candidatus Promineifilaceae bacterium]